MNIRLHKRENPFAQIDKQTINDESLSSTSLGVLLYIISKPNNWKAHKSEILKRFSNSLTIKDTKNKIDDAFIELRKAGYIEIVYIKDDKTGQIKGSEYVFYETPNLNTDLSKSSDLGDNADLSKSSDLGRLPTVEDFKQLNEKDSFNNNDLKEKENEGAPSNFSELKKEEKEGKEKSCDKKESDPDEVADGGSHVGDKPRTAEQAAQIEEIIGKPSKILFDVGQSKSYISGIAMREDFIKLINSDEKYKNDWKMTLNAKKIPNETIIERDVISEWLSVLLSQYCTNLGDKNTTPQAIYKTMLTKMSWNADKIKAEIESRKKNTENVKSKSIVLG